MVNYRQAPERVFHALADPTRREMIERLAREPMSIARLAQPFDISAPAVSKHIRVLEKSGLLRREIKGRLHICHLSGDGLTAAYSWLEEQRRFWEQSLDKLERYFDKRKTGGKHDDS